MGRIAALLVALAAVTLAGCNLGQRVPDHQLALGHLVAPQLAMSAQGRDLIVISFAEGYQAMIPVAQFRTQSWRIGAPYGLRTDGDGYWLESLSENAVTPVPAQPAPQSAPQPIPQPKPVAPKPTAPKGAGG